MSELELIVIPVSHYCDKARWALDRAGLAYSETRHLPIFQVRAARKVSGKRTVPILVTPEGILSDSTDISAYADRHGAQLYPEDEARRADAKELEAFFGNKLGPATRRMAYVRALPDKALTMAMLTPKAPPGQLRWLSVGYPVAKFIMRRALKLDERGYERSKERVEACFAEVERRLEDGRPFLTGDTFTAADMTFAALAAPALLPAEYGHPMPPLEAWPKPWIDEVTALRARPAGAFGLRMYAEQRGVKLS